MKKNWSGERLETSIYDQTMLEHLHRYALALELAKDLNVLDIACGEGYGANLLSGKARTVTAIDIDQETIEQAKKKYNAPGLVFQQGTVLNIPVPDESIGLVTCFETLEHITEHDVMLGELKRVMKPGGLLIISTPEKANYSEKTNYQNPFHKKELYGHEFRTLLSRYFQHTSFYYQCSFPASLIVNEKKEAVEQFFSGTYNGITSGIHLPVSYWVALASDQVLPDLATSLFQNPDQPSLIANEVAAIRNTITYKTGQVLLAPFKFIRTLFKK